MEERFPQLGTVTNSRTPHPVAPKFEALFADEDLKPLLLPLACVDGAIWGISEAIPVLYCEYTDSEQTGLRFRRGADGLFYILPESKQRLLEWEKELTEMGCEVTVSSKPEFKGGYVEFKHEAAVPRERLNVFGEPAMRVASEPEWLQEDQSPREPNGTLFRFLGQAWAAEFTNDVADFQIFIFVNADHSELAFVWQNS